MKKIYLIILSFLLLVSCGIPKNLGGKTYNFKSKKRTLQLIFEDDSVCKLKNIFHCKDIDLNVKEVVIECRYKRVNDTLFLKNVKCKNDNCEFGMIIELPIQNSKQCDFLNIKGRELEPEIIRIGPTLITEYEKYGSVPMIDIDTLYIIRNRIFLYKYNQRRSIGFLLK